MPFLSQFQRDIHFQKHGREFNAADAVEYERMADEFMFGAMTLVMRECVRANGNERLRFSVAHHHFGAANLAPEFIKTFYRVPMHTVNRHGGSASYFNYECGRMDL